MAMGNRKQPPGPSAPSQTGGKAKQAQNATVHSVLDVSPDPRTGQVLQEGLAALTVPADVVPKIDRLHRAVAIVAGVGLGVAVVEAAAVVEVPPTCHHVPFF